MKPSTPRPEQSLDRRGRAQRARSIIMGQSRAIEAARNALALRLELDARASKKERVAQPASVSGAREAAEDEQPGAEMLVRAAHRLLIRYLPGVSLPDELWKVRALLEPHMFGGEGRVHRDEVVELARQIDRILPAAPP
jgi:hypothetical protein